MKKILLTLLTSVFLFAGVQGMGVWASCFWSSTPPSSAYTNCVNASGNGGALQCGVDSSPGQNNALVCCTNGTSCPSGTTGAPVVSTGITCANNPNAINTAIGCIPINDQNALAGFLLRWGLGIAGGVAFLLILVAGFQIMTSRGDPNRLKAGQELMTSAIAGLLLLIFSLVILRIIGFDILNIATFQ